MLYACHICYSSGDTHGICMSDVHECNMHVWYKVPQWIVTLPWLDVNVLLKHYIVEEVDKCINHMYVAYMYAMYNRCTCPYIWCI